MGVSAEILFQGRKKNLAYSEVPIYCSYEGNCSTQRPLGHGLSVVASIIKYMEIQHSLLFFGLPGLILFSIGIISGFQVYLMYEANNFLPFGPTLITIGLLIIGVLLGMTGLILHAVINANRQR